MVFFNKKTSLSVFLIFFTSACQIDSNVNLGDDLQKQVIDVDYKNCSVGNNNRPSVSQ